MKEIINPLRGGSKQCKNLVILSMLKVKVMLGYLQTNNDPSPPPSPQITFRTTFRMTHRINESQGPTVPRSLVPKLPSSQALKPFYSSQNLLNSSLTLKQLLLLFDYDKVNSHPLIFNPFSGAENPIQDIVKYCFRFRMK